VAFFYEGYFEANSTQEWGYELQSLFIASYEFRILGVIWRPSVKAFYLEGHKKSHRSRWLFLCSRKKSLIALQEHLQGFFLEHLLELNRDQHRRYL